MSRADRWCLLALALTSAAVFAPFFTGAFLVGSTDLQYNHYPNILFGYDQVHRFGRLSLWNPYVFTGQDMSGSMHAHYLNPLCWPLFLLPRDYVFHGLTAMLLAMNFIAGASFYAVGRKEGLIPPAALLVGIVACAGMYFWFAATTLIAIPMYMFTSLAILLLRTAERRRRLWQFVWLSLCFAGILVTPHPAYVLGFALPIIATFLVTEQSNLRSPWRGQSIAVIAAGLVAIALTAYRLYPTLVELTEHGALLQTTWLSQILSHGYWFLTTMDANAIGASATEGNQISGLLGMGGGRHQAIHNGLYFGIAPLLLAAAPLFSGGARRVGWMWGVFLCALLTPLYFNQQVTDLVNLIIYPAGHEALYRNTANIAFLGLLIIALKDVSAQRDSKFGGLLRFGVLLFGATLIVLLLMWIRALYADGGAVELIGKSRFITISRFSVLAILAATILLAYRRTWRIGWGTMVCVVAAGLMLTAPLISRGLADGSLWRDSEVLYVASDSLLGIGTLIFVAILGSGVQRLRKYAIGLGVLMGAAFMVRLGTLETKPIVTTFFVSLAGAGKMLIFAIGALFLMQTMALDRMTRQAGLALLCALTAADLVGMQRVFQLANTPTPFVSSLSELYPVRDAEAIVGGVSHDFAVAKSNMNLLQNTEFGDGADGLSSWRIGAEHAGRCRGAMASEKAVLSFCFDGDSGGALFQDVTVERSLQTASFGVWLRVQPSASASIMLTNPGLSVGVGPISVPADGAWHWNTAILSWKPAGGVLRPHVVTQNRSRVEIYGPRLVEGRIVTPLVSPSQASYSASDLGATVSIAEYRLNRANQILQLPLPEFLTDYASVYRVRTYGGVDFDLPRDLDALLRAFVAPAPDWYNRGGVALVLKDQRLLDLLGVGLDVGPDGVLLTRASAIPRLSAFSTFEVLKAESPTLTRLKDPAFDPTRALVLDRTPDAPITPSLARMRPLTYAEGADAIDVAVPAVAARLVFFGDHYSPYWRASWKGQALPIMRADSIFMAVAVPAGEGKLELRFKPKPFYDMVKLALVALALLSAAIAWGLISMVQRRRAVARPGAQR